MHDDTTPAAPPTRLPCGHQPHPGEIGHQACTPCRERTGRHLAEIPPLYEQLPDAMRPGRGATGGHVSGATRTGPLPLRLEPLSLSARGGAATILATWVEDWYELLEWRWPTWSANLSRQLHDAAHALSINLPWAAEHHPAWVEFADDMRRLHGQLAAAVDPGSRPQRVRIGRCPGADDKACGKTLHADPWALAITCPCGARWSRADWTGLAERITGRQQAGAA